MGGKGSPVPAMLLGFSLYSQLACSRRRLCQWDMTERFCKHQTRTCSKPKYGWAPVTHVAVQWHWVSLDLPGEIELSSQSCWRIKTSKQKKMDEPARIMARPLEECGLNLYHCFHIHSPFWMSYSCFYCSGGKEIFWDFERRKCCWKFTSNHHKRVKISSCWISRCFRIPGVYWGVESCILPSPQCTLPLMDSCAAACSS